MPSPKAVLRDVADLGLDPKARHVTTMKNGRLSRAATDEVLSVKEDLFVEEPPVVVEQQTVPVTPVADVQHVVVEQDQSQKVEKIEPEKKPVRQPQKKKTEDGQPVS